METRKANVIFGKAGGNASRNSYTCKISLPKTWVDRMGLNPERREIGLAFDGDRITIERPEQSPIKHTLLASNQKIRRFALLWMQMYKNHKSIPGYYFDDSAFVGEGLADLGFEMDCGKSINEAFPSCHISDYMTWKRIVNQIDSVQLLGDTIFSQWRYWNHWSMSPMEEEDYQWFVLAFSRLAELTGNRSSIPKF